MALARVIYVSMLSPECDMDALQDILTASRRNNAQSGITGILCYDPAFFLQCLEGPSDAIHSLYGIIEQDPRHRRVRLIEDAETDDRLFGEWRMAFAKASEVDRQIIDAYSRGEKFDPYTFDADTARNFLVAIARVKGHDLGR